MCRKISLWIASKRLISIEVFTIQANQCQIRLLKTKFILFAIVSKQKCRTNTIKMKNFSATIIFLFCNNASFLILFVFKPFFNRKGKKKNQSVFSSENKTFND